MIIIKTPFRISFLGGGTDHPLWYREHGGAVISTTINKYAYISCRKMPPFFEWYHKIGYSKIECVNSTEDITHPLVRESLKYMEIKDRMEITYNADLPGRSGLGTSSAFTVGLLQALHGLKGEIISKEKLAWAAIYVEQKMVGDHVGSQDQVIAAYGNLNHIVFGKGDTFQVNPLIIPKARLKNLQDSLMLFFTGISREASEIEKEKLKNIDTKRREFSHLQDLVEEGLNVLNSNNDLRLFGKLLHEGWILKRSLSRDTSSPKVDEVYDLAIKAGAVGGKLLGAGGGGFVCLFVPPEKQLKVKETLKKLIHVPFRFENLGSRVIHYQDSNDWE